VSSVGVGCGGSPRVVLAFRKEDVVSLFEALVMLAVLLVLAVLTNLADSTRVRNWGVWSILTVISIPPGAVIVNSVLTIFGL